MLSVLYAFIKCLPEILSLVQTLQKQIAEAATEREIKDDMAKIAAAFKSKDPLALNNIFNS